MVLISEIFSILNLADSFFLGFPFTNSDIAKICSVMDLLGSSRIGTKSVGIEGERENCGH